MDKRQCLVPGEASESDDDENVVISVVRGRPQKALQGTVVPGEAPESDDDSLSENKLEEKEIDDDCEDEDSYSSASEAFMYRASAASSPPALKYDTLLHRKLCDTNLSLHQGVYDLLNKPLINTSQKLSAVNLQLLSSQVEIQDAVSSMKRSFDTTIKLNNILGSVLEMPYLPRINIYVPPKNLTS